MANTFTMTMLSWLVLLTCGAWEQSGASLAAAAPGQRTLLAVRSPSPRKPPPKTKSSPSPSSKPKPPPKRPNPAPKNNAKHPPPKAMPPPPKTAVKQPPPPPKAKLSPPVARPSPRTKPPPPKSSEPAGEVVGRVSSIVYKGRNITYPEYKYKGKWYPTCGSPGWVGGFSSPVANVLCKSLGYSGGVAYSTELRMEYIYYDIGSAGGDYGYTQYGGGEAKQDGNMMQLTCSGSEPDLSACLSNVPEAGYTLGRFVDSCIQSSMCVGDNILAGVHCNDGVPLSSRLPTPAPTPAPGTLSFRLSSAPGLQGLLEVNAGGRWGPVCPDPADDNGYDMSADDTKQADDVAAAACRAMGHAGGTARQGVLNAPSAPAVTLRYVNCPEGARGFGTCSFTYTTPRDANAPYDPQSVPDNMCAGVSRPNHRRRLMCSSSGYHLPLFVDCHDA